MSLNHLDEGFDIGSNPDIDFSVSGNIGENSAKNSQKTPTEIYTQLLIKLAENDTEESRRKIIDLVNNKHDQIDYVKAIQKLPHSVKLNEITPLLASVSVDRVNELRKLSIENALLEETLKRKRKQLAYLKGGFVEFTPHSFCSVCGLEFIEQPFIVKPDNTISHIFCNGQFKASNPEVLESNQ